MFIHLLSWRWISFIPGGRTIVHASLLFINQLNQLNMPLSHLSLFVHPFTTFKFSDVVNSKTSAQQTATKTKMSMFPMIFATTMTFIFDTIHHLGPFKIQCFGNYLFPSPGVKGGNIPIGYTSYIRESKEIQFLKHCIRRYSRVLRK